MEVDKDGIEYYLERCASYERKAAYQDYIHTMKEITEELKREGEVCVGMHRIKRPQFETGVVNLFQTMNRMFELMNEEKSFRMELHYNSEAQSAEVNFYIPKHESDDNNTEEGETTK